MAMKGCLDFIDFSRWVKERSDFVKYSQHYERIDAIIQEVLLYSRPELINKYTTCIDLDKLNKEKELIAGYFIDYKLYDQLKASGIINKNSNLVTLYPVIAIGDGNCLCHAVMIYLVGTHDDRCYLRNAIYNYINSADKNKELKERFMTERRRSNALHSIISEENILENEWSEVQRMAKIQSILNKNGTIEERVLDSLVYLEDIHIFALANLLRRPIIVTSFDTIKDVQHNSIRGIYLPVLNSPVNCVKQPIILLFDKFHFFPLIYGVSKISNSRSIYNDTSSSNNPLNYFSCIINSKLMDIFFLNENERNNQMKLLSTYLKINESKYEVLCEIGTNTMINNNFLSLYLNYINETINQMSTKIEEPELRTSISNHFTISKSINGNDYSKITSSEPCYRLGCRNKQTPGSKYCEHHFFNK